MKKIAVISAYPQGLNTGMLTVEYAFPERLLDEFVVDRYCIETEFVISFDGFPKLEFKKLDNVNLLRDYEHIIYWGDFLHWIGYLEQDVKRRARDIAEYERLIEIYFSCILLENEPELRLRSMLIGQTIYPLRRFNLLNARYKKALTQLINDARFIRFRDVYSSAYAKLHFGRVGDTIGVDAAFFLDTRHIAPIISSRPYLCYSFGRSGRNDHLESFVLSYAKLKGIAALNIDWLGSQWVPSSLSRKLQAIKSSELVITDIYHLGINSLREKKPVIMFGNALDTSSRTLADKKKEILFSQELIQEAYINCEIINHQSSLKLLIDRVDNALSMFIESNYFNSLDTRINCNQDDLIAQFSDDK